MPTRFYFTTSGSLTAVTPAYSVAWKSTSGVTRHVMNYVKGSSLTGKSPIFNINAGARSSSLERQYTSAPLVGAQTISGTVSGQLVVNEIAATDNVDQIVAVLKVVNNAGSLTSGMLLNLGAYNIVGEFSAVVGGRNKKIFNGQSITSVNASDGDRIVLEIGYWSSVAGTTPQTQAVYGETPPANDLIANELGVPGIPWLQFNSVTLNFSQPVTFVPSSYNNSLILMGMGG